MIFIVLDDTGTMYNILIFMKIRNGELGIYIPIPKH